MPANHRSRAILGQLRLKGYFVELCVAEDGEVQCLAAHVLDEALLAHDEVRAVAELDLAAGGETFLRLVPHFVKPVAARQEKRDDMVAAVTGERKVSSFEAGMAGR